MCARWRILAILCLAASLDITGASVRRSTVSKPGFSLTFRDDFSGTEGSEPSSSNWLFDLGTSYSGGAANWGTDEVETYTSTSSNIAQTGSGTLLISPQVDASGHWTSARIETVKSNFSCAQGGRLYIEASLKIGNAASEQQQGIWPAFWALGSAFRGNYSNWPSIGEWDIFESVNGLNTAYGTVHCGVDPGGPCNEPTGISGSTPFTRGVFHNFGYMVDRTATAGIQNLSTSTAWEQEELTWYLDGTEYFSVTGARVGDSGIWAALAHKSVFLLLNVAVGGSFPDALATGVTPSSVTTAGQNVGMEIDYVAVWNSV